MKRTQQCCLFLMSTLVWLFLVFAARASGATLFRKACGGPGGVDPQGNAWQADAYYTGGLAWTAANQASMSTLPVPYKILRYSSSAGAPVTWAETVCHCAPESGLLLHCWLHDPWPTRGPKR